MNKIIKYVADSLGLLTWCLDGDGEVEPPFFDAYLEYKGDCWGDDCDPVSYEEWVRIHHPEVK